MTDWTVSAVMCWLLVVALFGNAAATHARYGLLILRSKNCYSRCEQRTYMKVVKVCDINSRNRNIKSIYNNN